MQDVDGAHPDPGASLPNTVLKGKYQILSALRETDRSFLFRGRLLERKQDAVVKILKEHVVRRADFIDAYTRELQATQALPEHPNVIRIHDFDFVAQRYVVVTDWFESVSLDDLLLRKAPLPLTVVLKTVEQVGRVLGFAHREGLKHRHLKPDNVLVNPTTLEVKVLRFSFPRSNASGEAPLKEMVYGMGADVLFLGVLLYRLLCLRYPFQDRTDLPELVADGLRDRCRECYHELSPEDVDALATLFIRATTRDMDRRLGRYEDFLDEVGRLEGRCQPLVQAAKEEETKTRRELLETAFDTVAALKGEYRAPPQDSAIAAVGKEREEREEGEDGASQGLAPGLAPAERAGLVWSREPARDWLSLDGPGATVLLTVLGALALLGFVVKLFF